MDTEQTHASSIRLLEKGLLPCTVALKYDRFLKMGQTFVMIPSPSLETGILLSALQLWDFHTSAIGWVASPSDMLDDWFTIQHWMLRWVPVILLLSVCSETGKNKTLLKPWCLENSVS